MDDHTPEEHPEHVPSEDSDISELQELVFGPSASELEAAHSAFREGLVPATQAIVHLAHFSKNDRIRLDAAKYVVERNLGKVSQKVAMGDVWEQLFSELGVKKD